MANQLVALHRVPQLDLAASAPRPMSAKLRPGRARASSGRALEFVGVRKSIGQLRGKRLGSLTHLVCWGVHGGCVREPGGTCRRLMSAVENHEHAGADHDSAHHDNGAGT